VKVEKAEGTETVSDDKPLEEGDVLTEDDLAEIIDNAETSNDVELVSGDAVVVIGDDGAMEEKPTETPTEDETTAEAPAEEPAKPEESAAETEETPAE
ncbi:MAG: hypothetical protein IJT21_06785, partial [Synergistaceae bacterium]|nr:hypothetical protein [Synergistaceae bacterium]